MTPWRGLRSPSGRRDGPVPCVHVGDQPWSGTGVPVSSEPTGPGLQSGLQPGALVAGRYRLLSLLGWDAPAGAQLWRGRDVTLSRDVALTLVVGGIEQERAVSAATTRALRAACFEHPGRARVLDVLAPGADGLPSGVLAAAVAEWTPGPDLVELVAAGPMRPSFALRALEPLAAAVAAAHHAGVVLGCDHPRRIRLSDTASARLAFDLPRAGVDVEDDVRGLGAALYLMLTGSWPLPGQPPAGLPATPRDPAGRPAAVRELRPTVPVELAALVERTIDPYSGVRTAAAVARVLSQLLASLEDEAVLLPVTEDGAALDVDTYPVWRPEDAAEPVADPQRQRKLRIGMSLVALATVLTVVWVGVKVGSLFSDGPSRAPVVVIGANPPASSVAGSVAGRPASSVPAPPSPQAAQPAGPVPVTEATVYDPSGDRDNSSRVGRIIDGNPATIWSTYTYKQQFPSLKPGVGVMVAFRTPARISSVVLTSPSAGTRIEVRAAASPDAALADTVLLGSGMLSGGVSEIRLQAGDPTPYLLLWITRLGGGNVTQLAEVSFQGVAD